MLCRIGNILPTFWRTNFCYRLIKLTFLNTPEQFFCLSAFTVYYFVKYLKKCLYVYLIVLDRKTQSNIKIRPCLKNRKTLPSLSFFHEQQCLCMLQITCKFFRSYHVLICNYLRLRMHRP